MSESPFTLRANTCLDSPKTGLRVRDVVFKADRRKYNKLLPESLSKEADDSKEGPRAVRPARLGKFVLDALLEHGKKIWEDHNTKYKNLRPRTSNEPNDPDLLRPYEEAESGLTEPPYLEQLEILRQHVQRCRADWANLGSFARSLASPNAKARADTKQKQSSTVANIRKQFRAGPPPEQIPNLYSIPRGERMVKEIKASLAYKLGEKFALEVAFQEISALKSGAHDEEYPVHGKFRNIVVISSSVARRYNAQKASLGMNLS